MKDKFIPDSKVSSKRMIFNPKTNEWEEASEKPLFIKGPIPMSWMVTATSLPGKTSIVGLALWWLHGMRKKNNNKIILARRVTKKFNLSKDAVRNGLKRLIQAGLIEAEYLPGKSPIIKLII